jgi:hypothetical protein
MRVVGRIVVVRSISRVVWIIFCLFFWFFILGLPFWRVVSTGFFSHIDRALLSNMSTKFINRYD